MEIKEAKLNIDDIFGDKSSLTKEEFTKAIEGKKFVDASTGLYILKAKADAELKEKDDLITGNKKEFDDLKKKLDEAMKNSTDVESIKKTYEDQMKTIQDNYALKEKELNIANKKMIAKEALVKAGIKNPELGIKALDIDFEKIEIKDGALMGMNDYIESLQKKESYLFDAEAPKGNHTETKPTDLNWIDAQVDAMLKNVGVIKK